MSVALTGSFQFFHDTQSTRMRPENWSEAISGTCLIRHSQRGPDGKLFTQLSHSTYCRSMSIQKTFSKICYSLEGKYVAKAKETAAFAISFHSCQITWYKCVSLGPTLTENRSVNINVGFFSWKVGVRLFDLLIVTFQGKVFFDIS